MRKARRSMAAMTVVSALALTGAGAAWACDGTNGPSGSTPGTYPGESTTTTSTGTSTAAGTTSTTRHARRAHARLHRT
jgi:hypothetical protein